LGVRSSVGQPTFERLRRATGGQLWAFKTEGVPTTPVVVDGRVIVGTDLGKVIALVGSGSGSSP
jgi:outer membrane protein assembly factor BamB